MTARQSNILDKLFGLMPGYKGYAERQDRRSSDKRLRDHVAAQLDGLKRRIDQVILDRTGAGPIEGAAELDRIKRVLGTCADTIRHASYGESGVMDDLSVTAVDLERLHQRDLDLAQHASETATTVSALTSASTAADVTATLVAVRNLQRALEARDEVLREVTR